jgi:prolipoprotein diacylglyceryltransferase
VFLAFPYYPGLSLGGGIIGGVIFMYLTCKRKRYPFLRIFDFIGLSFLAAIPYGMLGTLFIHSLTVYSAVFITILYLSFFLFFFKVLYPKLLKGDVKEGRMGLYFLLGYGAFSLLLSIVNHQKGIISFFGFEDLLSLLIFIISLFCYIRLERQSKRK